MDDPGSIILKLLLLLILILVNAFFAMSEMAVVSLNDNKLRKMAEEGNKKAAQVLRLTENSSKFLSTIQIGVTLAGFLTSASAATTFAYMLTDWLTVQFAISSDMGLAAISGLSVVLITLLMSYFSLVLGELVPKRIALDNPEGISLAVAGVLLFFKAVLSPVVALLSASTNLVLRIIGIDPNAEQQEVTEEEVLMMVDAVEESGVIEESQKEMINNIFEFHDIVAAEVMTHRTDMCAVELRDSIEDVINLATERGYSRIPVYDEELDNIRGLVYVKDLLRYVGRELPANGNILEQIMREAYFVPESKRCGTLFTEMTERRLQMVIVSDEYGGVAGLVTMEDLLEAIVGNMQDEYDNEDEEFTQVDKDTFHIDGVMSLDEVEDELGIKLPDGDYDTIGGMVMDLLGRIPGEDETPSVEVGGFSFTVTAMDERRIEEIVARRLPEEETKE
jgi:putative hemolysin